MNEQKIKQTNTQEKEIEFFIERLAEVLIAQTKEGEMKVNSNKD